MEYQEPAPVAMALGIFLRSAETAGLSRNWYPSGLGTASPDALAAFGLNHWSTRAARNQAASERGDHFMLEKVARLSRPGAYGKKKTIKKNEDGF